MHMESANYLDPQCLESGELPVEELLRDSVYYPACAGLCDPGQGWREG